MSTEGSRVIEDLLAGRWRDPATGETPRIPIRRIVIERSLDGAEADLLAPLGLGRRLAVVSDANTHAALGRRVGRRLAERFTIDELMLETPRADLATAAILRERARHTDALVAVGSGTLNDLCKHVAAETGRRYAVFATAPSMNGYVTGTASLDWDGLKSTLPARCPAAALFDLEVLAAAPARMIRAGIGDVLCRTTAQTDWLLSHLLWGTVYSETPFRLQAADEPALLADAGRMAAGELDAIAALTRLLVLSGLGMVLAGGSQPASQAEHLISHYIDMLAGPAHPGSLHGEQVGVATLTVSRLQYAILDADRPPLLHPTRVDAAAMLARFGPVIGPLCIRELRAKALDGIAAQRLNAGLARDWDALTARLHQVMLPTEQLLEVMRAAGAPTTGAALGLSPAFYREAVRHAREVRNRFTILDLAADAGLLDDLAAVET